MNRTNAPASVNGARQGTKNGGRTMSADLCSYELQASNKHDTKPKTTDHLPRGAGPVTVINPNDGDIYSIRYYKRKRRERRQDEDGEEGEDQ
ncbi:MAG: hypothetical protein ABEJ07_05380 [Candidatus Nanohaloarchaea archaeon]